MFYFTVSKYHTEAKNKKATIVQRTFSNVFSWMKIISQKFVPEGLTDIRPSLVPVMTLRWRNNGGDSVSNHQPHGCLLNRLFRRKSKKTSKLCVTGLCAGNSPGPVNSPHKGPVTRKMFPFDDVIMTWCCTDDKPLPQPMMTHFIDA